MWRSHIFSLPNADVHVYQDSPTRAVLTMAGLFVVPSQIPFHLLKCQPSLGLFELYDYFDLFENVGFSDCFLT